MAESKYRPTITTEDLWAGVGANVGSDRHDSLIDLIAACRSKDDEELLVLLKTTKNYEDVARVLNISPEAVESRYRRLVRRANRRDK